MTTKEQERKALEQIKQILSGLDPDGWVATAMDGMIEDAEENIECDFAMSWKNRAETAEKRFEDLQTEYNKQVTEATDKRLQTEKDFIELQEQYNRTIATIGDDNDTICRLMSDRDKAWAEIKEKDNLLAKRDFEIMQLKAKLYDMMTKGGE